MFATMKGRKHTPEARARMSAKLRTPEVRAKLSAVNKGKPRSPETRAKISATLKGRKRGVMSSEWRAKISESHKIRWEKIHTENIKIA